MRCASTSMTRCVFPPRGWIGAVCPSSSYSHLVADREGEAKGRHVGISISEPAPPPRASTCMYAGIATAGASTQNRSVRCSRIEFQLPLVPRAHSQHPLRMPPPYALLRRRLRSRSVQKRLRRLMRNEGARDEASKAWGTLPTSLPPRARPFTPLRALVRSANRPSCRLSP